MAAARQSWRPVLLDAAKRRLSARVLRRAKFSTRKEVAYARARCILVSDIYARVSKRIPHHSLFSHSILYRLPVLWPFVCHSCIYYHRLFPGAIPAEQLPLAVLAASVPGHPPASAGLSQLPEFDAVHPFEHSGSLCPGVHPEFPVQSQRIFLLCDALCVSHLDAAHNSD